MRILFHPQISMRSRSTDKLITEHDAQWVKAKEVVRWLLYNDNQVRVLLPTNAEVPELMRDKSLLGLHISFISGHGNVKKNRFHFMSKRTELAIQEFDPDIIWLEVPELVANYKSITNVPVLATFEHFLDEYFLRQYEGYLMADARIIPTIELQSTFRDIAIRKLSSIEMEVFDGKSFDIWGNFISKADLLKFSDIIESKMSIASDKIRILFPSRLTDFSRTKWAVFLSTIRFLLDDGYIVELCNPSEVGKPGIIQELEKEYGEKNIVFHSNKMSREQWLETIARTDIALILYSFDEFYSVSAIELLASGVKLITKESHALRRIAGIEQLFFVDTIDETSLSRAVKEATICSKHKFDVNGIIKKTSGIAWAEIIFKQFERLAER